VIAAMTDHDELALLLINGSPRLAWGTAASLEGRHVVVTRVPDLLIGLREALRLVHDAVLLELERPVAPGLELCRDLRAHSDVPLVVVAEPALGETERVAALEAGADDCVVEPFSPIELLARIHAAVRRARRIGSASVLRAGPLALFVASGTVTLHGKPLDVTSYEFAILRVLAERRGRVLTREQILDYAKGGAENAFERSIDVRISRLRRKLGEGPRGHSIIRTVRGSGYALTPE
jgi:DNA-binding response OmpR family regulator